MSSYSVADAKTHLSNLIDRALAGEGVIITRHGQPVIEFKPIPPVARPITDADLDWLDANRVGTALPQTDAGTLVSEMRDDDWR